MELKSLTLNGTTYDSFPDNSAVKTINGTAPDENGNVEIEVSSPNVNHTEPAEDDIPKVFFGGALQQTKDEVVVPFRYISKTEDISGYAEIKAQGNSSMSYPKKNQTVKMFKDAACEEKLKVDFKGWGKQNKHCYKANWIDLTHARNVVSARIWGDIVKSRADYENLPELLRTSPNQGAVDGFPIKVYADGVYQGRYTLNIPKDKWMANMDDELDAHCILCGEGYVSGCFRDVSVSQWTDEVHDTMPDSIKTRWLEVISFVMNSTDDEFKANLGNYFDIPSLIDYHLYGLQSCGLDAYGKNQLYMTYDGQKWLASMYDMDSTWGLWWTGGSFVASDYARTEYQDYKDGDGNLLYIRLEQNFVDELKSRWAELRTGALSIANIINRFERFTDICPAELVKEDYAPTTGGGQFDGIPSKTTNNIQQIRTYALERQAFVDAYVDALVTPVYATGITLDKTEVSLSSDESVTLTATVTPENTTEIVTWSSSNTDVAVVNNGIVAPVGQGSCTITAKVGNFSATCEVEVAGEVITEVNYVKSIASSGTQYIDTGIVPTSDMVIEISFNNPTNDAWEGLFGVKNGIMSQFNTSSQVMLHAFGSQAYSTINTANVGGTGIIAGNDHVLTIDCPNSKAYVDGVDANSAFAVGTATTTYTTYVFACCKISGAIDTYGKYSLYYFTIKNGSGELIMELKPCLDAAGTACLYDTVSQKYFRNVGTGEFTYEPLAE